MTHHQHYRSIERVLFVLVFFSCAYFYSGANVNHLARITPVFSFVEPGTPVSGTFQIDAFQHEPETYSCDVSFKDGHTYSNKAPGTILLNIPAYFVVYWLGEILFDRSAPPRALLAYLVNLWTSVFFVALGVVYLFRFLLEEGVSKERSVLTASAFAFCSFIWPFSTQLWGHPTAAALLIFALYFLRQHGASAAFRVGLLGGFAAIVDYLASFPLAVFGLFLLFRKRSDCPWFALGVVPALVLHSLYMWFTFDAPFGFPTDFTHPEFLSQGEAFGLFGIPNPIAAWMVLFSPPRGIVTNAPILFCCFWAGYQWWKSGEARELFYLSLSSFLAVLLAVASFNHWDGGWSITSRYLIVALPFLFVFLARFPFTKSSSALFGLLAGVSFLNMLAAATISPFAPVELAHPVYGYVYELFFTGRFAVPDMMQHMEAASTGFQEFLVEAPWNLGERAGLGSWLSLAPWAFFFSVGQGILWRVTFQKKSKTTEDFGK